MFVRSVEVQQPTRFRDVAEADGDVEHVFSGVWHVLFTDVGLVEREELGRGGRGR